MKTLTVKQKIAASIVAVMLLTYGIQGTDYVQAQNNAPELTPVSERTPQVRDAIVALVPGVESANDVTAAHLSLISNLNLSEQDITTLKAGDFDGLSALDSLALYKNRLSSLPADLFSGLSSLSRLDLGNNDLSSLPADLFSEVSSLSWLSLSFNELSSLPAGTFSGLSALNTLNLSYNQLRSLSADLFSEVSSLRTLNLSSNKLSSLPADLFSGVSSLSWLSLSFNELIGLPAGIFSGLSSLRSFYLGDNAVNLSITVFLERIEENQFKASAPTGAPFNIVLPLSVVNGAIDGGATTIEIPAGSVESEPLTVAPTPGASDPISVDIVVFPELPTGHYGYSLAEPSGLGGDNESLIFAVGIRRPNYEPNVNHAPVFTEGIHTIRSVAENTDTGVNIGSPVVATDEDDDPLTYGIEGPDAVAFGIVGTTGQLQTRAPLDYETKNAYAVTVIVSDGRGGVDTIGVTISVTDENDDPIFIEGDSTTRSVAENTEAGMNMGGAVSATDEDGDPLTYTLGGIDAASFGIVGASGQLQTRAPLDYETKNAYSVAIMVSDGNGGTDTIGVAIKLTDEDEAVPDEDPVPVTEGIVVPKVDTPPQTHAPVFAGNSTTRAIAENTPAGVNIGSPVSATDEDGDALTYTLGGTNAASFSLVKSSGQLQTHAPLDYETKNAYSVTVTVSDGGRTDSISVVITIIDVDESPRPGKVGGEVSISEIMFGSEIRFTPKQWIEISNSGSKAVDLTGWKLTVQNVNSEDLLGPATMTVKFSDSTFDDAPRIWPNDVLLIVTSKTDDNSGDFLEDQIYDLRWIEGVRKDTVDIGFWTTWMSTEGFRITLTDKEGNLVDEVGNYDGKTTLWDLPYGFNRGRIRAGNRTSMIRRYADSVALDGTQAAGWISAVDANLTADQHAYYGDENDISSPGAGIVVNDVASQFVGYDANQDGVVNVLDLVFIAGRFGQSGPNSADVNGDGVVSILDLIKVASAVNQAAAAPSLHPEALSRLTAADIREWLIQAQGSDLTDPGLQRGILFLEQLLSVLVPKETELLPNYPNPFNPETWIPYRLAEDGFVTLTIYDQRGRVVRRLTVGHQTASVYESRSKAIYWDGRNAFGEPVASGIYFYTLTAGDFSATRRMLILK